MKFSIGTEYGVDQPSEISDALIVATYRATEMVIMNPVHFPKADFEYCEGNYEFLCDQVMIRGLQSKIDALDDAQLRADERSEVSK